MRKKVKITAIFLVFSILFAGAFSAFAQEEQKETSANILSYDIKEIFDNSIVFYKGFYKASVFSKLLEINGKACVSDGMVLTEFLKENTDLKAAEGKYTKISDIAENNGLYLYECKNLIFLSETELKKTVIEKNILNMEKMFAIFVSPDKNGGTGTIDSPFNSVNTAKTTAKKVISELGYLSDSYSVILRGGRYEITDTLSFTNDDSGYDNCKIIYEAFFGEVPVFDGGISVSGSEFKRVTNEKVLSLCYNNVRNKIYAAEFGSEQTDKLKNLASVQPYYDGSLMQIARWPNIGYSKTGKIIRNGNGTDGIEFTAAEEKIKQWQKAKYAYVFGFWVWEWDADRHLVTKIDVDNQSIGTMTKPRYVPIAEGKDYYIYNLIEELDSQNEFYFDKDSGILYLIPYDTDLKEDTFKNVSVQIPVINQPILSLNNAENLEFKNIVFENSNNALISVLDSKNCAFRGCTARNAGDTGIEVKGNATKNVTVDSCDVYKTGSYGISINNVGDKQNLISADVLVTNCKIYDTSITYRTNTPALNMTGVGITASHNQIFNMPHIAFKFHGVRIYFEYNEVFNSLTDGAHDAGTMHNGRRITNEDSEVRYNYFHNLNPNSLAVLYEDDHNPCHKIHGNIFYKTGRAVFIHGGRYNDVYNNIMIYPSREDAAMVGFQTASKYTWDPDTKASINCDWAWWNDMCKLDASTPLWLEKYPRMNEMMKTGYVFSPEHSSAYNNVAIYENTAPENIVTVATDIPEGDVDVHDNYSTTEDVGFYDMKNKNFALNEDARIYKILPTFENPHFEKMGLYLNEYRNSFENRGAVNLISPIGKEENVEAREVEFRWSSDRNTSVYRFELALDKDFKEAVRTEYVKTNHIAVKNLRYDGTRYYWRVFSCAQNELTDSEEKDILCKEGYSSFTTAEKETINTKAAEENLSKIEALAETVVEGEGAGMYFKGTKSLFDDLINRFHKLIEEKEISQKKFDKSVSRLVAESNKLKGRRTTQIITINDMLADRASWTFQPNNVIFENGISWIRHANGDKTVLGYKTKKIETNQILKFKARFDINSPGQWQYFSIRSSQYDAEYSAMKTYIVIMKPHTGMLELQRYGTEKFLYKEFPCDAIKSGEDFMVEIGAVDMEDGSVRVIFKINGETYIDYNDNDCQITEPGYFTVYMPDGNISNTISLMPVSENE